jgi:hypothetical protein
MCHQKDKIFLKFRSFQISTLMAFHYFQLCEDETKNGIIVFEHIILYLNSTFFGVDLDFTDKEIQSHPTRW